MKEKRRKTLVFFPPRFDSIPVPWFSYFGVVSNFGGWKITGGADTLVWELETEVVDVFFWLSDSKGQETAFENIEARFKL